MKKKQLVIVETVCKHFEVNKDAVLGKSRVAHHRNARHVIMYLLRDYLKMTLKDIGNYMNRDHTSVIHALRNIEGYIQTKDWITSDIQDIRIKLSLMDFKAVNRVMIQLEEGNFQEFISDVTSNYKVKYSLV
jgi:hypothetical protein